MDEAVVEAILGDDGRLTPWTCGEASFDSRGRLNEVRELLKEDRRLLRLSNLRTPFGF